MTEHPEETVPEPVSPELVLVDPQLANVARERLRIGETTAFGKRAVAPTSRRGPAEGRADAHATSDEYAERLPGERVSVERAAPGSPDDHLGTLSAVAESELEFGAISPEYARDDQSVARARPRKRRVFAATLGVLAVAAASFPIVAHEVTDSGGSVEASPIRTESTPGQRLAGARQNRRTSEPPRAGAGATSPHSTKPAVKPKKRLQPVRQSEFPTRVFVWPAASRATFYKVEFFRRGRRIFEASPATPRIELPLRWIFRGRHFRLTPGTYRWEVRAAFGPRSRPRYGKLITRSMWTAQ
jgi:hypothetical protein